MIDVLYISLNFMSIENFKSCKTYRENWVTLTRDRRIASLTRWPLGHAASSNKI